MEGAPGRVAAASPPRAWPLPGDAVPTLRADAVQPVTWGPYVLGRRIGRGAMGVVHAAVHRGASGIARLVAVKILMADRADDPAERAAFLREARILARLDHPNVVRWLDAGEVGGDVFLAMELLHGASLAQILAASPERLPLPIALAVLADLARGLHAAHELVDEAGRPLGLVHQDVSPQNAVVGYDGRTRLVDFGIARLASVDASRTDTVRGKPAYLAPEQLEGRRLDRRTDVFALGVMAFEILAGRRLFARASIAETHTAVLFEPIPDLRDVRPDLPADLAAVVACALARSASSRFRTAEAFRRALVEARDAAGIPQADEREIAQLAEARVPPPWTPPELFAEIAGDPGTPGPAAPGEPLRPPADELSQAATVAPLRAAPAPSMVGIPTNVAPLTELPPEIPMSTPSGWTRALVAAGVVVALGAGFLATRSARAPSPADGAASAAATLSSGVRPVRADEANGAGGTTTASPKTTPTTTATAHPGAGGAGAAPSAAPTSASGSTSSAAAPSSASLPAISASATPSTNAASAASAVPTATAEAPAAAPAPTNGWVSVWSTPWGHVRIDGRAVGDSPAVRIAVPPGPHSVIVKTDAGEQARSVTVKPGEEAKIRFVF